MRHNRRNFLKTTTAGVAIAAPYVWTSSYAHARDANSKPTVAGIGLGGSRGTHSRGRAIASQAAQLGKIIAVCDVDEQHMAEFNSKFDNKLNQYVDYRVLLEKEQPDVVTIGTPDHWHVPIAIAAMRNGSDVYCEKPLTLTIDEGKEICKVVQETGRVFQVGTQQRSGYGGRFLKAVAMIQGGYLGNNVNAHVAIGGGPSGGPFQPTPPPQGLDWDFWVGPAPTMQYSEQRRKEFRWFFEYSGGKMTDWGAHHIDIAQWAIGASHTDPTNVNGTCTFPPIVPDNFDFNAFLEGRTQLPHAFNTPIEFHIELKFANGSTIGVHHHYKSEDGKIDEGNGILFSGDKGRMFVSRSGIRGKPFEDLSPSDHEKLDEAINKLYKGMPLQGHMQNFFTCLEDRTDPISDVYTHQHTMTSCHLCNIALMLGRPLQSDPDAETFVGDEQATALMSRPRRKKHLA